MAGVRERLPGTLVDSSFSTEDRMTSIHSP
jgi:hypothetical protein